MECVSVTDPQTAFVDVPADAFPFVVEFFRESDGEIVYTITVEGPGAIHIPPMAQYGKVGTRIRDV